MPIRVTFDSNVDMFHLIMMSLERMTSEFHVLLFYRYRWHFVF